MRIIQDMIETQSSRNISQLLIMGHLDKNDESTGNTEGNDVPFTVAQLNQKEIYARISSNIELIGLYLQTNEKIINEPGARPSRLLRDVTQSLA